MWIEDLTKALWELNASELKYTCCVKEIKNGKIVMTSGKWFEIADLVAQYDKHYGSGNA